MQSVSSLIAGPFAANTPSIFSICSTISNLQNDHYTQNQLIIWLSGIKQVIYNGFSVQTNPSSAAHHTENTPTLSSCILLDWDFPPKTIKAYK